MDSCQKQPIIMTGDKLDKNVALEQLDSSVKLDVAKLSDLKKKIQDLKLDIDELDETKQKVKVEQEEIKKEVNATSCETKEDLQTKNLPSEAIKETTDSKSDSHDHDGGSCGCCTQFDDDYDCDSDIED